MEERAASLLWAPRARDAHVKRPASAATQGTWEETHLRRGGHGRARTGGHGFTKLESAEYGNCQPILNCF